MVIDIEKKVKQTIGKKSILNKNEKIVVALSGGKDSAVTAYVLKKLGYNIKGLYVDLCVGDYSKTCLKKINELCQMLDIKLSVYNLVENQGESVKEYWEKNPNLNHCSACGVLKKWVLNKQARKLKADKIATGHNLEDEAQTFLMNIFKGSPELSANTGVITQNPEGKNTGKFIPRIKPLYYIHEEDVLEFAKKNKIPFLSGKCPYAEQSYRIEIREFLEKLNKKQRENILMNFEKIYPKIDKIRNKKTGVCKICGEPARGDICKMCRLKGSV